MEYILAVLGLCIAIFLIWYIIRPVSSEGGTPEHAAPDTSGQRYDEALKKDLEELKDSPFLEPVEAAMCREIEFRLGPKHRYTPGVYYLDQAQLRGPCEISCPMYDWGSIILSYDEVGYDKIHSSTRRDAVTLHLIPRLQAKYPQLGIECTKVLEHDRKDPMTLYEHKAILVNYALVNSSPLKQV